MKVLVIGYGSMGQRHATNAQALGHQVCATDIRTDLSHEPVLWAVSLTDGLSWQPDAVLIATPAATHERVAKDLVAHAYHGPLFVEKPLAVSEDETGVFVEWPHLVTMTGYNLRWHPGILAFQRALLSIGRAVCATAHVFCDMNTWPGRHYTDPLLECSHEIDLVTHIFGPGYVAGMTSRPLMRTVLLQHALTTSTVTLYVDYRGYSRGVAAVGPDGVLSLAWDPAVRYWRLTGPGVNCGDWAFDYEDTYRAELAHFLECVTYERPTDCPFTDGLTVLRLCTIAMDWSQEA